MKLFDTHAHLTDERFDNDRSDVIASLPGKDVSLVVDVACDVREAETTVKLIDEYDFIYGATGMHPHEAAETTLQQMDEIKRISGHKKMLAIGEIGLDYHYDFAPKDVQIKWFATQLELAQELKLPVILHIREAFGDCLDVLRSHKNGLCGVMHCFSGSPEFGKICVDLGLYVAFGGAVTFTNAKNQKEAARVLPIERMLIETDCPYMTPVPHRGERNDPSFVRLVADEIAMLRGISVDEVAQITCQNGMELFGISK